MQAIENLFVHRRVWLLPALLIWNITTMGGSAGRDIQSIAFQIKSFERAAHVQKDKHSNCLVVLVRYFSLAYWRTQG